MQPDNQIRDRPRRFYSIDGNGEFKEHETKDEARAVAVDAMRKALEHVIDKFEWPDWVYLIQW